MVGKGVLLECLDEPEVKEVLSISRNSLGMNHPKLKELIHDDFRDYSTITSELNGYDACYFCLGITSVGQNEANYTRITHDFTIALAKTLYDINSEMTFTYVTGAGTDSSEKGNSMWARVKGKTENELLKMGFRQAFMFRPGMIIPERGIRSKTKVYQFFLDNFGWLLRLLKKIYPTAIVNTTQIGRAMIAVTQKGYEKVILDPSDILKLDKL